MDPPDEHGFNRLPRVVPRLPARLTEVPRQASTEQPERFARWTGERMDHPPGPIAFIDLHTQSNRIRGRVEAAWRRILDHGAYVMGPEVGELEARLAAHCGGGVEAITCASGTDALWLPLLALGIGAGDAVFLPSWTFAATAEAVCLAGATPVFVDIEPAGATLDPASLAAAVEATRRQGRLRPRAVIPVDIFGVLGAYDAVNAIAAAHGLAVIADAAQSFGGGLNGRRVGTLADVTGTSFYPSKPLGCWGDGGAMFTADAALADVLRSLRAHGQDGDGGAVRVGTNARLDSLQAAVLIEKLAIFDDEMRRRHAVADRYHRGLAGLVEVPEVPPGCTPAWALYTIRTGRREHLRHALARRGVPTRVFYDRPLHLQPPYRACPVAPDGLPVTERLMGQVLSVPMHPYLDYGTQRYIIEAVREALAE